jgi:hypothetical protein
MGDVNAVCLNGACQPSCATDYDCNPGLTAMQFTRTCNANNVCEAIGCEEDAECAPTVDGVKLFCTAIPVVAPGANIESAITD